MKFSEWPWAVHMYIDGKHADLQTFRSKPECLIFIQRNRKYFDMAQIFLENSRELYQVDWSGYNEAPLNITKMKITDGRVL
jgi:hypothetical protein